MFNYWKIKCRVRKFNPRKNRKNSQVFWDAKILWDEAINF